MGYVDDDAITMLATLLANEYEYAVEKTVKLSMICHAALLQCIFGDFMHTVTRHVKNFEMTPVGLQGFVTLKHSFHYVERPYDGE